MKEAMVRTAAMAAREVATSAMGPRKEGMRGAVAARVEASLSIDPRGGGDAMPAIGGKVSTYSEGSGGGGDTWQWLQRGKRQRPWSNTRDVLQVVVMT